MEALQTLYSDRKIYPHAKYDEFSVVKNDDFAQSQDGLVISEEEYWEKYYHDLDYIYEWNNGYLEEKPVSDVKGSKSYQWFCRIMDCYFQTYPIGVSINLDIGFRLEVKDDVQIRRPDMAIVMHANPITVHPDDCTYKGIYDICVESLSHSTTKDIKRDTVIKKNAYEAVGVKEYYILDARRKETAFYRHDKEGRYKKISPLNGDIIQSVVMPGFQFRIADLYSQPSLEDMVEDDLYNQFVLPSFREAKQHAEIQKQRATKAENLLAAERQRAEQLAAKLRELGISTE